MKPVSRMTSRMAVKGTRGKEFQRLVPTAHLTFLLAHLRCGDVVGLEDSGELGEADADEAGVAHDVENGGEGNAGEGVPEVGADGMRDVLVGGQTGGCAGESGGQKCERGAAGHGYIITAVSGAGGRRAGLV